jgi:hypothetical protein
MSEHGQFLAAIRRASKDLALMLTVPRERVGRTPREMPCFCGPETRAAQTHAQTCPRWLALEDPR